MELAENDFIVKQFGIVKNTRAKDCWFWGCGAPLVSDLCPVSHLQDPEQYMVLDWRLPDDGEGHPIGWRPIMEPVDIDLTDDLIGTRIVVWRRELTLCGKLVDISEYDLILDNVLAWPLVEDPSQRFFKSLKDRRFVVNRQAL